MKTLNEKETLVELNPSTLTIQGDQLALEDRRTGKVYITTKPNINKLFDDMGYRSLTVVNILKEFAGKIITNVGDLDLVKVYADELTNTCVITSENAINWLEKLSTYLNEHNFTYINVINYDDCRTCDEYILKSPNGTYFAIDIDLVHEVATLYSMNNISSEVLLLKEGDFYFQETSSIQDIQATLNSKIDLLMVFDMTAYLSVAEYMDFLARLGIVKKGRKAWFITELGEEEILTGNIPNIDINVDAINELSWLKAHIELSGVTFKKMCEILTYKLDSTLVSRFDDFYLKNMNEQSDYFLSK